MDFSKMNDGSGLTTDEKLQQEIGGDMRALLFQKEGEPKPFLEKAFREGVTFEWVKNQVADVLETRYQDISLYMNDKRIPEPFCLVDLGVKSGQVIMVRFEEGAIVGHEALRAQVLKEIEDEGQEEEKDE
jgi:hypothetical protein